jgi:hypothetical protein
VSLIAEVSKKFAESFSPNVHGDLNILACEENADLDFFVIISFHFDLTSSESEESREPAVWRALEKRVLIQKIESLLVKEKRDRCGKNYKNNPPECGSCSAQAILQPNFPGFSSLHAMPSIWSEHGREV